MFCMYFLKIEFTSKEMHMNCSLPAMLNPKIPLVCPPTMAEKEVAFDDTVEKHVIKKEYKM